MDTTLELIRLSARIKTHKYRLDALAKAAGSPGPQGPQGEPGLPPKHQWERTQLRFEKPDGSWGKWVDLQGPQGVTHVIHAGGGGGGQAASPIVVTSSFVPTRIRPGATFVIPEDTQALFAETILCEGIVQIDGDLVMV